MSLEAPQTMTHTSIAPTGSTVNHPAMLHWYFGYDRYEDGWTLDQMENEQQRNGWHAALAADLAAQEIQEDIEDRDFWRRGGW